MIMLSVRMRNKSSGEEEAKMNKQNCKTRMVKTRRQEEEEQQLSTATRSIAQSLPVRYGHAKSSSAHSKFITINYKCAKMFSPSLLRTQYCDIIIIITTAINSEGGGAK